MEVKYVSVNLTLHMLKETGGFKTSQSCYTPELNF